MAHIDGPSLQELEALSYTHRWYAGLQGYANEEPDWSGCTTCYSDNDRECADIQAGGTAPNGTYCPCPCHREPDACGEHRGGCPVGAH